MLAWFLYIGKVHDYENHRSNPYQETTGGVGVHRALRPTPFMQKRSQILLFKAQDMPSKEIAESLSCSELRINHWVSRYLAQGVYGLRNKPSQGAKTIMDTSDGEAVRLAIEKDRLSVMKAKEKWQQTTGKRRAKKRTGFLSALAQDLDV